MEAGQEFGIVPTGPSDIRRIEGAIFNWGADMTYDDNPIEMGLERLVDWDTVSDDDCISMAALRRIRDAGVDRRIVGVEIDGDPFPALNNVKWPVSADGEWSARSPRRSTHPGSRRTSASRGCRRGSRTPGTTLAVASEWGDRGATVVEMPFVDPKKQIPVG